MEKNVNKDSNEIFKKKVYKMYTPLSEAKEEIWKRWNSSELKKKSEHFWGVVPDIFQDKPRAIIFRNIATPNFELKIAHEYAQMMGLDLVVVEYTADKFCTRNQDKLHLGKMLFSDDKDKLKIVSKEKIISIKEEDNKRFFEIATLWGENLVSFHHRIFKESGYADVGIFDISVYKNENTGPHEMYMKILGLCTCHGVLLESFLVKADSGEKNFTEQIIIPAFLEIEKIFGFKPLITPLFSANGDGKEIVCWQYYSQEVREKIFNFKA